MQYQKLQNLHLGRKKNSSNWGGSGNFIFYVPGKRGSDGHCCESGLGVVLREMRMKTHSPEKEYLVMEPELTEPSKGQEMKFGMGSIHVLPKPTHAVSSYNK